MPLFSCLDHFLDVRSEILQILEKFRGKKIVLKLTDLYLQVFTLEVESVFAYGALVIISNQSNTK